MGSSRPLGNALPFSRKAAWILGALTTLAHLAVFLAATLSFRILPNTYTNKGDGASYKHVAERFVGDRPDLDDYDSRVFPGYPLFIAATHVLTRLSIPTSALLVTFIAAGLAATLSALYFNDLRIGLAVAFLLPHAWINMSIPMSEAPMLAAVMLALLASRINGAGAGAFFGLAMLIRPIAAVPALACAIDLFTRRRPWSALLTLAATALTFLLWNFALAPITGNIPHHLAIYSNSPRDYAGHPFTWPFHSIITMTLHGHVSPWRWIYIMTHVALCIGGCVRLLIKNPSTNLFTLIWLALNTLFVLCLGLGPGAWGFNHFPRFTIPALPALAYAWKEFLPRRPWVYILLGAGFFVMAIFAIPKTP
jgi:hypothetical protein